jgi:hypothetical protein
MALTLTQVGNAGSNGTFITQLQGSLQTQITLVLAEAGTTADYVVRRKFAQLAEKNLGQTAAALAVPVAAQLAAGGVVSDLNAVTDTQINTALVAIFTQLAYATILPS